MPPIGGPAQPRSTLTLETRIPNTDKVFSTRESTLAHVGDGVVFEMGAVDKLQCGPNLHAYSQGARPTWVGTWRAFRLR